MADTSTPPEPTPAAGKNEHVPTETLRQMVRVMTASEIPQEMIYGALGISKRTFHRHYKDDVKYGLVKMLTNVTAQLYKTSLGTTRGAVRAQIYLKHQLEAQLRRHHGLDLGGKTFEQDVADSRVIVQLPAGANVPALPKL